jgi:hypothetical protein
LQHGLQRAFLPPFLEAPVAGSRRRVSIWIVQGFFCKFDQVHPLKE